MSYPRIPKNELQTELDRVQYDNIELRKEMARQLEAKDKEIAELKKENAMLSRKKERINYVHPRNSGHHSLPPFDDKV